MSDVQERYDKCLGIIGSERRTGSWKLSGLGLGL